MMHHIITIKLIQGDNMQEESKSLNQTDKHKSSFLKEKELSSEPKSEDAAIHEDDNSTLIVANGELQDDMLYEHNSDNNINELSEVEPELNNSDSFTDSTEISIPEDDDEDEPYIMTYEQAMIHEMNRMLECGIDPFYTPTSDTQAKEHERIFVKDFIGDVYKYWQPGEVILIGSQTGSGKTTFVMDILLPHCINNEYRMLYLVSRTALRKHISVDYRMHPNVTLITYQFLEQILINNEMEFCDVFIDKFYDIIVADEAHYFFSDSLFNKNTMLSLKFIEKYDQDVTLLFMSATPELVSHYLIDILNDNGCRYTIEPNYSYIEQLWFYNDDEVIRKFIDDTEESEKFIYFTDTNTAMHLNEIIENSTFICSKNNHNSSASDTKTFQSIIDNNKFDVRVLLTTQILDVGISIIDESVKNIVIDIGIDLDTIQQCIGRKRISDSEKINVFIKLPSPKRLSQTFNMCESLWNEAQEMIQLNHKSLGSGYSGRMYNSMTVIGDDGLPALNEAKYLKVDELLNDAYDYIHDRKGNPDQYLPLFREKVQERLINANYKGVLDEELLRIRVQRFIHAHLDKKFFSEEKEEIKEFFTMHYDENTKSITTINRAIDSLDLPYFIDTYKERSRTSPKRDTRYWMFTYL